MKDELVRINDKGEAHPIGVAASQRMRAREGAYRVMPAPRHVVFMRLTGEDGRRDAEDGEVVRLSGEIIEPAALCDIIAMVGHTRWRGALEVRSGGDTRTIYLENGNVVGANTNVARERIGEVMFRYGAIDEQGLAAIIDELARGVRFGEAAVSLGLVTAEQLYDLVGKQIEEIVYGAIGVDDGTFFFLDGFDAERLVSHHILSVDMLLMEAVTKLDEIRYFRQKVPSADWVPVATGASTQPSEEYRAVLSAVDGRCDVAEIGRLTGQGEFETTKALYALVQSRHVEMQPPRLEGGAEAVVGTANQMLRIIHTRVDSAGQGTAFRDLLQSFAAGAGEYELIFMGAGPDNRGALDPARVCHNVAMVAGGDEESYLRDKLHEYISFALFATGNVLGSEAEASLAGEVTELLSSLQPPG